MDLADIVNILAQNIYLVPPFKGHRMDSFSFSELKNLPVTIMQFTEFDLYAFSDIMERRATPVTDNSFTWSSVTWEDVMIINRWL